MAGIPRIGKGVNSATSVQLLKGGQKFDMTGATVRCVIVSADNEVKLSEQVVPLSSDTGANFSESLIVIKFMATDKQAITVQGAAEIEVVVSVGAVDELFYVPILLVDTYVS